MRTLPPGTIGSRPAEAFHGSRCGSPEEAHSVSTPSPPFLPITAAGSAQRPPSQASLPPPPPSTSRKSSPLVSAMPRAIFQLPPGRWGHGSWARAGARLNTWEAREEKWKEKGRRERKKEEAKEGGRREAGGRQETVEGGGRDEKVGREGQEESREGWRKRDGKGRNREGRGGAVSTLPTLQGPLGAGG